MGDSAKYESPATRSVAGEESSKTSVDSMGSAFVTSSVHHAKAYTPAPGAILGGPCDKILLAADGTVTLVCAEDSDADSLTLTLKGGQWHDVAALKVTAASQAVTLGWVRRPPEV